MWDPVVVWLKRLKRQPPPLFAWHGLTVAGEPQIVPTYVNDPEASGGMAAWNVLFCASDQATEPGGKHALIVYTFCAEGCEGGSQNHGVAYEAPLRNQQSYWLFIQERISSTSRSQWLITFFSWMPKTFTPICKLADELRPAMFSIFANHNTRSLHCLADRFANCCKLSNLIIIFCQWF